MAKINEKAMRLAALARTALRRSVDSVRKLDKPVSQPLSRLARRVANPSPIETPVQTLRTPRAGRVPNPSATQSKKDNFKSLAASKPVRPNIDNPRRAYAQPWKVKAQITGGVKQPALATRVAESKTAGVKSVKKPVPVVPGIKKVVKKERIDGAAEAKLVAVTTIAAQKKVVKEKSIVGAAQAAVTTIATQKKVEQEQLTTTVAAAIAKAPVTTAAPKSEEPVDEERMTVGERLDAMKTFMDAFKASLKLPLQKSVISQDEYWKDYSQRKPWFRGLGRIPVSVAKVANVRRPRYKFCFPSKMVRQYDTFFYPDDDLCKPSRIPELKSTRSADQRKHKWKVPAGFAGFAGMPDADPTIIRPAVRAKYDRAWMSAVASNVHTWEWLKVPTSDGNWEFLDGDDEEVYPDLPGWDYNHTRTMDSHPTVECENGEWDLDSPPNPWGPMPVLDIVMTPATRTPPSSDLTVLSETEAPALAEPMIPGTVLRRSRPAGIGAWPDLVPINTLLAEQVGHSIMRNPVPVLVLPPRRSSRTFVPPTRCNTPDYEPTPDSASSKHPRFDDNCTVREFERSAEELVERAALREEENMERVAKGLQPRPEDPLHRVVSPKKANGHKDMFDIAFDDVTGDEISVTLDAEFVDRYKAVRGYWDRTRDEGVLEAGHRGHQDYGNLTYRIPTDHPEPMLTAWSVATRFVHDREHFACGQFKPASPWKDVDISDVFSRDRTGKCSTAPPRVPLPKLKRSDLRGRSAAWKQSMVARGAQSTKAVRSSKAVQEALCSARKAWKS